MAYYADQRNAKWRNRQVREMHITPIGVTLDGVTELQFSRGKLDRDYKGNRQGCRMVKKVL
jgi:hypothetical protein